MSEKVTYPCTNCKNVDVCNTPQCARWRKWFKATWREETEPFRKLSEKVREKREGKQKALEEQVGENVERCVVCDETIPEGRQVCPMCEETTSK